MPVSRFIIACSVLLGAASLADAAPAVQPFGDEEATTIATSTDAPARTALDAEAAYRDRLARLRRLRTLAMQRSDEPRLRLLDEMGQHLRTMHAERLDRLERRLDEAERSKLVRRLAEGRDHSEWIRQELREQSGDRLASRRAKLRAESDARSDAVRRVSVHRQTAQEHRDEVRSKLRVDRATSHGGPDLTQRHRAGERRPLGRRPDEYTPPRSEPADRATTLRGSRSAADDRRASNVRPAGAGLPGAGRPEPRPAGVPPAAPALPSQADVDARAVTRITPVNLDAEFELLRDEIDNERCDRDPSPQPR